MSDHANGSSSIKFSERSRKSFSGGKQLVTKGVCGGSSSSSSTSFDVGFYDNEEITFSVSVTDNSNHDTTIGTSEYQLNTLPTSLPGNVKTIELWDDDSFASTGDVSIVFTIGISITGDVEVDVDAGMSSSDIHTIVRTTETIEKGPRFNSKLLTKFWTQQGHNILGG